MQGERGDIIGSWLVQLLLIMVVVGLVGHELLAVAITSLRLDGAAHQVADAAADAHERDQDEDDARTAAEQEARVRGAEVVKVRVDDDTVHVTVRRATGTLVVHLVPGLDGLADVAATRRARWVP